MIHPRSLLFILGVLLTTLAGFMLIPAVVDLYFQEEEWQAFIFSAAVTSFVGLSLILATRTDQHVHLSVRETFLLTTVSWSLAALFSSLPFLFSSIPFLLVDALFECVSGLSTTGATILMGLDTMPKSILLWRSLLQWLGGIGIIVMAMAVLPVLRIGGMQLFHSEFSDRSEKILPRVSQITAVIFSTYSALTFACILLLFAAGMPFFDAICHGLSTLSTGGFSTKDASIGAFPSLGIQAVTSFFMFLGGATLILVIRFFQGEPRLLLKDRQFKGYCFALIGAILALTLWQVFHNHHPVIEALTESSFSVVSILTTTGFVAGDFSLWGSFPVVLFFILFFIGGCTGSTSGGIKVFRFQVLFAIALTHIKQLIYPHGYFMATYNKSPITENVFNSVLSFFALYVLCYAFLAFSLSLCGLDLITCLSGAASAIGNVGPGLGEEIGPSSTYIFLPDGAKYMLMVGMILGRLELLTVLVLFLPHFWRP